MEEVEITKNGAINWAISYMKNAKTFKSKVGACLYTKEYCYGGYNIETRIHKGYHAEEVAIINALLNNIHPRRFKGIIIVYEFKGHTGVYPACASCRQFLHEFTNPDLLVTVVDTKGKIIFEDTLKNLYPQPYPNNPMERWEQL